ncbi:MAG: SAM hydrolase/SAM-dependent halogenase family protein, partial [Blastocatellia bacterium]
HEIPAQDISYAAFTLGACYRNFPAGTIHVAVVDPGVGSSRRAIVVKAGEQFFVGPDNGIFSYVYQQEEQAKVLQIERDDLFRQPVSATFPSQTFHGRDVFAPIAAHLSTGLSPESVGREIADFVKFEIPRPIVSEEGRRITGSIIHIDRFGNCITNLTERELLPEQFNQSQISNLKSQTQRSNFNAQISNLKFEIKLLFAGQQITQFGSHFAQAKQQGELFAYPGSAGYWEIALWCDSAAEKFAVNRGSEVILDYGS